MHWCHFNLRRYRGMCACMCYVNIVSWKDSCTCGVHILVRAYACSQCVSSLILQWFSMKDIHLHFILTCFSLLFYTLSLVNSHWVAKRTTLSPAAVRWTHASTAALDMGSVAKARVSVWTSTRASIAPLVCVKIIWYSPIHTLWQLWDEHMLLWRHGGSCVYVWCRASIAPSVCVLMHLTHTRYTH